MYYAIYKESSLIREGNEKKRKHQLISGHNK